MRVRAARFLLSAGDDRVLRPRLDLREDPQVGGTSLEIVLSSWCSGRDICTRFAEARPSARLRGKRALPPPAARLCSTTTCRTDISALCPGCGIARSNSRSTGIYEKVVSRAGGISGAGGVAGAGAGTGDRQSDRDAELFNFPLYCEGDRVIVDELWRYEEMWERLAALAAASVWPFRRRRRAPRPGTAGTGAPRAKSSAKTSAGGSRRTRASSSICLATNPEARRASG